MASPSLRARCIARRQSIGWSQEKLAKRAGTTQTTVHYFEAGTHEPSYGTVEAIIQSLGFEIVVVDAADLSLWKAKVA